MDQTDLKMLVYDPFEEYGSPSISELLPIYHQGSWIGYTKWLRDIHGRWKLQDK